ncbi:hypothetical protein N7456_006642, partial [Penicillium angulare]
MLTRLLIPLAFSAGATIAEAVGYFDDTSICVDPKGLAKCYEDSTSWYSNCISENCAGGGDACSKSCNGDPTCMVQKCPNLGVDCISACGCVKTVNDIDCIASSCWNQVYSCEYQRTVEDILNLCVKPNLDGIPFWPPPDGAKAGCSCQLGKVDKKEQLISAQLEKCANNMTNLNQMSTVDEMTDYSTACTCCTQSAIVSTIWDTCPNTDPSDLAIDDWYTAFLEPNDWESCGKYIDAYDCAGDLGFGAESAGDTTTFYKPDGLPKNGTESMYNTGALSTPVSGATFTWTFASEAHVVTAMSTDNVISATGKTDHTATGTSTETGASSTPT